MRASSLFASGGEAEDLRRCKITQLLSDRGIKGGSRIQVRDFGMIVSCRQGPRRPARPACQAARSGRKSTEAARARSQFEERRQAVAVDETDEDVPADTCYRGLSLQSRQLESGRHLFSKLVGGVEIAGGAKASAEDFPTVNERCLVEG